MFSAVSKRNAKICGHSFSDETTSCFCHRDVKTQGSGELFSQNETFEDSALVFGIL